MPVWCWITIPFSQTKINNINLGGATSELTLWIEEESCGTDITCTMTNKCFYLICFPTKTHEKVIRFDIPMQEAFRMYKFYSGYLHGTNNKHSKQNNLNAWNNTKERTPFSQHEVTIWSANINTVFNENFLPQYTKRSSRLGPSKSRTRTLSSPLTPDHFMPGMPPAVRYSLFRERERDVYFSTENSYLSFQLIHISKMDTLRLNMFPIRMPQTWPNFFPGPNQLWWFTSGNQEYLMSSHGIHLVLT